MNKYCTVKTVPNIIGKSYKQISIRHQYITALFPGLVQTLKKSGGAKIGSLYKIFLLSKLWGHALYKIFLLSKLWGHALYN